MAAGRQTRFFFESGGLEPDAFLVAGFRGEEAISRLYRFEIDLVSEDPAVDLDALLRHPASLRIEEEGDPVRRIAGVVSRVEQLDRGPQYTRYRVELVPRLWWLTLSEQNQIYQNKALPEIVASELRGGGLENDDFELRLSKDEHPAVEYVVQYRESDLDFVSRRLEHEGVFYYFEDADAGEKLVVCDSNEGLPSIPGDAQLVYRPESGLEEPEDDAVRELVCRRRAVTGRVMLRDYNYRTPKVDLHAETRVVESARGLRTEYGAHFRTTDEGRALARIRSEEIACRRQVFEGSSTCTRLRPGHVFELVDHYRSDLNQSLLLTRVVHEAEQGVPGSGAAGSEQEGRVAYHARFEAVPASVRFRPERLTPRPRLHGVMNARVEGETATPYAELDEWGRYKVRMPFDVSDAGDGRASRYIRKAEPYGGETEGMHFPLRKDTEVLWTCVDGDPDRPIIIGAVPNPDSPSQVTSANRTRSVLRTASGCLIEINDKLPV